MAHIDLEKIARRLDAIHAAGRTQLLEHEVYEILGQVGLTPPRHRLLKPTERPTADCVDVVAGERIVLKIASEDIIHKSDVGGVRVVDKNLDEVERALERMLHEVPARHAQHLEATPGHAPEALAGLTGADLTGRIAERLAGVVCVEFVSADAKGLGTELFVGVRDTDEFGPVITAGLGGVEMEALAQRMAPGQAVALAPVGMVDADGFLARFKKTLSYARLAGELRGSERLVTDAHLREVFEAFLTLTRAFSSLNPEAKVHIAELEVNPFQVCGGQLRPLDGVCRIAPAVAAPQARPRHKIEKLLRPASAAIIGVSEKGMNMGRIILGNIVKAGFDKERVYVVRPGSEAIDGVRCVPSIAELPEKVDLFVVAVGAGQVPGVVTDLIEHDRANAVILIPGGLGEKEGSEHVEAQLKAAIAEAHTRGDGGPVFIGGNSLGVVSHPGRYDTFFIPDSKLPKSTGDHARKVAFVSQSGAFVISNVSRLPWLDPAFALSIGNQIDLTAGDLVAVLKEDPEIEVLAVYMEGFNRGDGLEFARVAREAIQAGKEVVFYKAGRTQAGRSATAGHTASVAGDYAVCEAAVEEAGALVARDFGEFGDLLRLAVRFDTKQVRGMRLAAMSNAGFEAVGMADSLEGEGTAFTMAPLTADSRGTLAQTLATHRLDGLVDVKNPLDVTPMATDAAWAELVGQLLADDTVDLAVLGVVPLTPSMQTLPAELGTGESVDDPGSIAQRLPAVVAASDKPAVAVIDSGERFDALAERLEAGGVPTFRNADRAVRTLRRWAQARLRRAGN